MNLYRVISEEVSVVVPILDDGTGPTDYYHIVELVVARNHGQAKYLAWKNDKAQFSADIRDMPKFSARLLCKNVPREAQIVATEGGATPPVEGFSCYWAWDLKDGLAPWPLPRCFEELG